MAWMGLLMPCRDARVDLCTSRVCGGTIRATPALAWQATALRCDLRPPCARPRRQGHHDTWRLGKPGADGWAMGRTAVVTPAMNRADRRVPLPVPRVANGEALARALPVITVPVDLARTGVQGRHEREGPCTPVLGRVSVRQGRRLGWPARRVPRSRLSGGRLVHGHDQGIAMPRPRVEVAPCGHCGLEGGVPRRRGRAPPLRAPGWALMGRQHPAYGGHRPVGHHARCDELARAFGAIPLEAATTQQIRACAGQAPDVDGDLGGKTRPWRRGQGRRRARPDAGREHAWPSGGPRSIARRPPAPPRMERTLRPAGGASSPGGPILPYWWAHVATVPASDALRETGPWAMKTCGRMPSRSPPHLAVRVRDEIPARALQVKPICIGFHGVLYYRMSARRPGAAEKR